MSSAERHRELARASYRRVHGVHPTRYKVGRRLLCRECWDELTPDTAARNSYGNPAAWCKPCHRKYRRALRRRHLRKPGARERFNARQRAWRAGRLERDAAAARARYWRNKRRAIGSATTFDPSSQE